MKGKLIFKLGALSTILSCLLIIPALGQSVGDEMGQKLCAFKAQTFKELKIAPDKEKAMSAMEEKCVATRQEIMARIKKCKDDLQAALAAANPDEAKVKALVTAFNAAQVELFNSYKKELDDELAQMTPLQQGKYLMALERWRVEVCMPATR
jgi:Spy/CpxP family protein refolding chaperone